MRTTAKRFVCEKLVTLENLQKVLRISINGFCNSTSLLLFFSFSFILDVASSYISPKVPSIILRSLDI